MSDVILDSRIINDAPDIIIKLDSGELIEIQEITVSDGNITSVIDTDGNVYSEGFTFYKNILNIPGIGNVVEGARVIYREKDYVLLFGWHVNISNQNIYSWHLKSLTENIPDKTLYKEMINELNLVHFR